MNVETLSVSFVLIISGYVTYSLFLAPLARFPGPLAAKVSFLWLTNQCRHLRRSRSVAAQHAKYGSFVRIGPNHISVDHPDAANAIYSHKAAMPKSEFYDAFLQVRPVVFTARDVDVHQRKRKYVNPAFSARALREFEPMMTAEVQVWKKRLLGFVEGQGQAEIDFVTWTNFLAFDAVASFAFGTSFEFIEKGQDPTNLIGIIDARGEVLNALGTVPSWLRPLMKHNCFDPWWGNGLRATANFEQYGRRAYQNRLTSESDRQDLLSHLFEAREDGQPITENEIIAEAISFIVGGSDTTSSTMANFIDIVARDQILQRKLQAALDESFSGEQDEGWVADSKEAESCAFLVATLREVLRVRPTSSTGLERIVPEGGRVIAGAYIPGGTIVSMPTIGLMSNPSIFEDPTVFRPERWLESDSAELLEHFLPFSTGPRACIGRNFAWMEILKAMATLFKLFTLERSTQGATETREGFFNKIGECKCVMRRRVVTTK